MRLFVDYNYQDCDPGNSSSAESSDGNSTAYVPNYNHPTTMSSGRVTRGTSEPPVDYHARTGLRKSGCPFKVSGIVMGSQENLASSDDEKGNDPYSIFGKRLRRSITPVRTASYQSAKNTSTLPRPNTDQNTPNTSNNEDMIFSTPFGTTQNNNSKFKTGIKSDLSHWGNPRHNPSSSISNKNRHEHVQSLVSADQSLISEQMENSKTDLNAF